MKSTPAHALADFSRDGQAHLQRLKSTGEAEVLTVNGRAELVVQSTEAYQKLLDAAERAETLPALRQSLAEADRNEGRPARDVLAGLAADAGFGPVE